MFSQDGGCVIGAERDAELSAATVDATSASSATGVSDTQRRPPTKSRRAAATRTTSLDLPTRLGRRR